MSLSTIDLICTRRNNNNMRDIAQKVHPSYTNFSLVHTTATRDDIKPFLRAGRKNKSNTSSNKLGDKKKGPRKESTFPHKLYKVLSDLTLSDVITWMPHGRSWSILDQDVFVERVGKERFSQKNFASFRRQLNGWGFRRKKEGLDRGSYYHDLFIRGMPHLALLMVRGAAEANKSLQRLVEKEGEPDLYKISTTYPVPWHNPDHIHHQANAEDEQKHEQQRHISPPVSSSRRASNDLAPTTSFSPPPPYPSGVASTIFAATLSEQAESTDYNYQGFGVQQHNSYPAYHGTNHQDPQIQLQEQQQQPLWNHRIYHKKQEHNCDVNSSRVNEPTQLLNQRLLPHPTNNGDIVTSSSSNSSSNGTTVCSGRHQLPKHSLACDENNGATSPNKRPRSLSEGIERRSTAADIDCALTLSLLPFLGSLTYENY